MEPPILSELAEIALASFAAVCDSEGRVRWDRFERELDRRRREDAELPSVWKHELQELIAAGYVERQFAGSDYDLLTQSGRRRAALGREGLLAAEAARPRPRLRPSALAQRTGEQHAQTERRSRHDGLSSAHV